jgi:hypothetical protein
LSDFRRALARDETVAEDQHRAAESGQTPRRREWQTSTIGSLIVVSTLAAYALSIVDPAERSATLR